MSESALADQADDSLQPFWYYECASFHVLHAFLEEGHLEVKVLCECMLPLRV